MEPEDNASGPQAGGQAGQVGDEDAVAYIEDNYKPADNPIIVIDESEQKVIGCVRQF
jgi:hypothetical protein